MRAISVDRIGKRYRLGARGYSSYGRLTETLSDGFSGSMRRLAGRATPRGAAGGGELWALRDVSFEVHEGEVVGVIGPNGAGKSTLLKLLSRITSPTEGRAVLHGRTASLLEVGTGFHPELSGRENIFLNGAICGMRRAEIERKFDAIVDFAGIEPFIDTPVKRYSSGMYVRLAFAVAAHLEPEILLIDEVLAVGDAAFQRKCRGRMDELAHGGRTILFVSHNLAAVSALCERAILIDKGRLINEGPVPSVLDRYLELANADEQNALSLRDRPDRTGNGALRFTSVSMSGARGTVLLGDLAELRLEYEAASELQHVAISASINGVLGEPVCFLGTRVTGLEVVAAPRRGVFTCSIPRLPLAPGRYSINVHADVSGIVADWVQNALTFDVVESDFFGSGQLPPGSHGRVMVEHSWSLDDPDPATRLRRSSVERV